MKGFSIILSFIFLFQSVGLTMNDCVQLDDFIEHAQFHNKEYGDNIFVFVSKHYGELKLHHNKEHKEEKKDHEQLPFQHKIHVSSIAVLSFGLVHRLDSNTPDFSDNKSHDFFYQESSSSLHLKGLLQPPKFI